MATTQVGIHHTTGITGDAQANVDFYADLLGLRLVKRTVNHNDKTALHLFYGDGAGTPGALLSFFAWPDTARGRRGVGQATEIGLAVPQEHIGDWVQRLLSRGVAFSGPDPLGETSTLALKDPDGLPIVIVGVLDAPAGKPWAASTVPTAMQIRGIHHVTFWTERTDETGQVLEHPLETDLKGLPVLVIHGEHDLFLPHAGPVAPYLRRSGAKVREETLDAGHELGEQDRVVVAGWLRNLEPR